MPTRSSLPLFLLLLFLSAQAVSQSSWAHLGPNGRLLYAHTPQGDRIPDFSFAGYRGGGVALPSVPVRQSVSPSGSGDDTPAIQAALDAVAKLPLTEGARGAVELAPGVFHLAGTLQMIASGVVLRGAGNTGHNATTLQLTGAPHLAIKIKGELHQSPLGKSTNFTDTYIPAGATVIHVADASGIHPGDTILLAKPVTPAWIRFMGMDNLSRDGKAEVWLAPGAIKVRRRVAAVSGNTVTLQVPLTDSFDSRFYPDTQPPVTSVEVTGLIAETGVENLRVEAPARIVNLNQEPEFDGISMDDAVDSWLRSLSFKNTINSVRVEANAERMTIVNVDVEQQVSVSSNAKPFDFSIGGSQILVDRCSGKGDKVFYVATQRGSEGPVVVLHCRFSGDGHIEPHQRWSTGLLVDSSEVKGGMIHLGNRGEMGTGHGWTIGWSVLWNNTADKIVAQSPPGSANWTIGDKGTQMGLPMPTAGKDKGPLLAGGVTESPGRHVEPASLYLQQLRERLGPEAIVAIGY